MAQERSDVDSGLDQKKKAQYRCVINITWLPLIKHAMLVKKGHNKVKRTIGSCFNSLDSMFYLKNYKVGCFEIKDMVVIESLFSRKNKSMVSVNND